MDQLNQLLTQRRKKADELADMNVVLYANDFKPTHHIDEVLACASEPDVVADGEETPNIRPSFKVAGRIIALRKFGKASFLHIQDESSRIQVYVKKEVVGEELYTQFKNISLTSICIINFNSHMSQIMNVISICETNFCPLIKFLITDL